ncbi:MAG: siderophore-interacting protein [Sphingopyxis sp.]|uniref:siderophore-interacting protein n=1 Tax=Sphingopyxis sp. TaxID=1908224 RepID=UPI002AB84FFA|nr:siderophore-interacting protein [Sphingopyxis sp.]MDZ3831883.1 siderophore-interacting protein [Sphingopyxis sp.]
MNASPGAPSPHSPWNPLPYLFAKHFSEARILSSESLGPRWRAIRLHCPDMPRLRYVAGQHVRIELRAPFSVYGLLRPIETMRTYTIWDWDEDNHSFELRVFLHECDGIGLNWAHRVRSGDRLRFWGPQGDFRVNRAARSHIFVGDETAMAAFGPMMRDLPHDNLAMALIEVECADDRLSLPTTAATRWLYREGQSPVASRALLNALTDTDLPDGATMAYVAGEAKTCQLIRDHLLARRGWDRSQILVKPFWAPGKRGLH